MKADTPMLVLWRRKWIVIGVFLAFAVSAAVVSKMLDKVYETKSTLIVAANLKGQTFDQVQASQALARSYDQILGSPNIAQRSGCARIVRNPRSSRSNSTSSRNGAAPA